MNVFDRGRSCLWPLFLLIFDGLRLNFPLETMVICLGVLWCSQLINGVKACWNWAASWIMHWKMADLISTWYRDDFTKRMRAKGIKPSHALCPSLCVLPARFMVLSAVMQLPYALSLIDHPQQGPPPCVT